MTSLREALDAGAKIEKPSNILILDIERAPGEAYWYDRRIEYLREGNVKEFPRLLCFAARWYGSKTPIFKSEWTDRDAMIREAWKLYNRADIVVTYNGKRFDNKHLASEWLLAGLDPPLPWKDVDLLAVVRAQFGFECKSLDSVTRRLGRPGKVHHFDINEALEAAAGDRAAQRSLQAYNVGDVELTEWLYDRLRAWIWNHPFIGSMTDEKRCNRCNSTDLKPQASRYRAVVIDYVLFRCGNCGGPVKGGWHSRAASTRGVR